MLPTSYTLPSQLLEIEPNAFLHGGLFSVYKGTFRGSEICAKRIMLYTQDTPVETAAKLKVHFSAFPSPSPRNH